MNIRKVKYFYKEGDHASEVFSKAIEDVGVTNLQEYNTKDFQHIEEGLIPSLEEKYPHDNVPCVYYKDQKLFEYEPGMSDEEIVDMVKHIYDQIKDLPY